MKYRRWMNGADYLAYEGCYQFVLWILFFATVAGAILWFMLKII